MHHSPEFREDSQSDPLASWFDAFPSYAHNLELHHILPAKAAYGTAAFQEAYRQEIVESFQEDLTVFREHARPFMRLGQAGADLPEFVMSPLAIKMHALENSRCTVLNWINPLTEHRPDALETAAVTLVDDAVHLFSAYDCVSFMQALSSLEETATIEAIRLSQRQITGLIASVLEASNASAELTGRLMESVYFARFASSSQKLQIQAHIARQELNHSDPMSTASYKKFLDLLVQELKEPTADSSVRKRMLAIAARHTPQYLPAIAVESGQRQYHTFGAALECLIAMPPKEYTPIHETYYDTLKPYAQTNIRSQLSHIRALHAHSRVVPAEDIEALYNLVRSSKNRRSEKDAHEFVCLYFPPEQLAETVRQDPYVAHWPRARNIAFRRLVSAGHITAALELNNNPLRYHNPATPVRNTICNLFVAYEITGDKSFHQAAMLRTHEFLDSGNSFMATDCYILAGQQYLAARMQGHSEHAKEALAGMSIAHETPAIREMALSSSVQLFLECGDLVKAAAYAAYFYSSSDTHSPVPSLTLLHALKAHVIAGDLPAAQQLFSLMQQREPGSHLLNALQILATNGTHPIETVKVHSFNAITGALKPQGPTLS